MDRIGSDSRRRRVRLRLPAVLVLLSAVVILNGCPVFYAWLYGEAEIVVTNNTTVAVAQVWVYVESSDSLVYENSTPIPVGGVRVIAGLSRLPHRVEVVLQGGDVFSLPVDLTDLDRVSIEVATRKESTR